MEKKQTKGTHINHVLRVINGYGLKIQCKLDSVMRNHPICTVTQRRLTERTRTPLALVSWGQRLCKRDFKGGKWVSSGLNTLCDVSRCRYIAMSLC